MLATRYEEYNRFVDGLPFVLYVDLQRSRYNRSEKNNWHENLEIQNARKAREACLWTVKNIRLLKTTS